MWNNSKFIKYIGMSMRSNLAYRDIFASKYGKSASEDLGELVLRPPELILDAKVYGPDGATIHIENPKLRKNIETVRQNYFATAQNVDQETWLEQNHNLVPHGKHQLTLTPTLFWYDNTHICETKHYRDFCFYEEYKMITRGGFVEEQISPCLLKGVERFGLARGHQKFGCYLLDDHSGYFFTGHLDGGSFLVRSEKDKLAQQTKKV
eukprot:CAMPEP_0202471868 /NCGR_PEP_ID=MMETSP1360-20130828/85929_1 /ASSEMBLY_ACC=CAM_ASM_000848 /TAXON_ID=515479 /ORGANISM="Licmophora paradoxa, Strain CCMP2313" /LENGTH=206 /DNA_ID=CAMNT_0049098115 /DNA_START=33 /DNA_END=653 /DNA_ORIENTATION=+